MRLRLALLPILLGSVALSNAQYLGGTGSSSNSVSISDTASYLPMTGGWTTVDSYFQSSNNVPNSNYGISHGFTNLVIPGVGGLTNGSEAGHVTDNLTNGATAAIYTANLIASGMLVTTTTGAGSDAEIRAATSGAASDTFKFSLSSISDLNLFGSAGAVSGSPLSVLLALTNTDTNQVIFLDSVGGGFTQSLVLGPGNYSLIGSVQANPNFDFNAFQGTLSNQVGSFSEGLNYEADFTPPSSTPEPSTFALAGFAVITVGRRIRRR